MAVTKPDTPAGDGRRSIQSVETGFPLLAALVEAAIPLALRDLASRAGMTSAKAHPYLVSFIRVGLVQQDPVTGQYELGAFALQMGLVSLRRLDPVRIALPHANQLAVQIGHTVGLAILGSHGPTMIHICEASRPVHVNMRQGTVMSMLHTATGHVFAAWLPDALAQHYIQRETGDASVVTSIGQQAPSRHAWQAVLNEVREHGMARAQGNPLPGIDAFSAPVFNHSGDLALALTCLGPSSLFDSRWESPIANALRECTASISLSLGFKQPGHTAAPAVEGD